MFELLRSVVLASCRPLFFVITLIIPSSPNASLQHIYPSSSLPPTHSASHIALNVSRCLNALMFCSAQAKMPFDANKLYCSEILAIILQNNDGKRIMNSLSFSAYFLGV